MQVHVIQTLRLLSGSGASVRSVSDTFYWEDTIDGEDRERSYYHLHRQLNNPLLLHNLKIEV